jgi:hypothetical protein
MIKLGNISPDYMELYPRTLHNQGCENLSSNTGLDVHFLKILWHDAWTPEACIQKSTAETESIARQRLDKTRFWDNQLEESVAEQR